MSIILGKILALSIMLHSETSVFRYHIIEEPTSLEPHLAVNATASYVLNSLYTALMAFQKGRLYPLGAESCKKTQSSTYECVLRSNWRWSDGTLVTPEQYIRNFEILKSSSPQNTDIFRNIKSLTAQNRTLKFVLHKPDADFLYRLIDPAMSPYREGNSANNGLPQNLHTPGPYYLHSRIKGRSLYLKPNPHFFTKAPRPDIEVLIIESDDTALRLYETKKLNFLRRLNTENVPRYLKSKDLISQTLHRLDFIGFGRELDDQESLREKLIYGLDKEFKDFQKMLYSVGRPGCLGYDPTVIPYETCLPARKLKKFEESETKNLPKLKLYYASRASLDITRGMQLFQMGWRKNAGLEVELENTDHHMLEQRIRSQSPPPLFRKSLPVERPTCLAVLELFTSGSLNNFAGIKDKKLDEVVEKMTAADAKKYADYCREGLARILPSNRIIPTGVFSYYMLSDGKFRGFKINAMNQLDVTELRVE